MAYARPKRWSHGDIPDAAEMNKYSDSLNAIHDISSDSQRNYAQLWSYENFSANHTGSDYYFVHRNRWLIYRGDGEIVDPSGAGETLTLSGDGTNLIAYDLNGVVWITPGKLYQVKDCVFALENGDVSGVSAVES